MDLFYIFWFLKKYLKKNTLNFQALKWDIQTRNRILKLCQDVPLMAKIEEIGVRKHFHFIVLFIFVASSCLIFRITKCKYKKIYSFECKVALYNFKRNSADTPEESGLALFLYPFFILHFTSYTEQTLSSFLILLI